MGLRKMVETAANWLKYKVVYTAIKPTEEFVRSGSIDFAKQSIYDAIAEITSSTPMSASITRFPNPSLLNRAAIDGLHRWQDGFFTSACRGGSSIIHFDSVSGSGVFVSGSYYSVGAAHGQSVESNFELVKDSIEYMLREKIAIKKGRLDIASEASSSYIESILSIKSLSS